MDRASWSNIRADFQMEYRFMENLLDEIIDNESNVAQLYDLSNT